VSTHNRIPNWQYLKDYEQQERQDILGIVERVFSSGRLILGPEVELFEANFAAFCGAAHGVGVNSCTDALFLALKCLGLGDGDEVLTVANTAVPTVAAIRAAGCRPVFLDVDADTFLMDPAKIEEQITPSTRCLVPVHLCGHPVDMAPLLKIAADRAISVVEDCAQAAGALYHGQRVGAMGVMGAFSFYPTKILGGFGDGGMLITSDDACAARLRRLRFYGMQDSYCAEEEGYNSRLDELQAAFLEVKLQHLHEITAHKRSLAELYLRNLKSDFRLPAVHKDYVDVYHIFNVRHPRRDALRDHLTRGGIGTEIHYPVPPHRQTAMKGICDQGSYPISDDIHSTTLSLPISLCHTPDDVLKVIERMNAF